MTISFGLVFIVFLHEKNPVHTRYKRLFSTYLVKEKYFADISMVELTISQKVVDIFSNGIF